MMSSLPAEHIGMERIKAIADQGGFSKLDYVEKFLMDFVIARYVIQNIDCTIRGGMCMAFHTARKPTRLSIDIDLLTGLSVRDIDESMEQISQSISEFKIKKYVPKNPFKIPNLATYHVEYDSHFPTKNFIKIDFLCDVNVHLQTELVPEEFDILGMKMDYQAKILTHGALIGDKITALSLDMIGLRSKNFQSASKQVYDIATMLKLASKDDIINSFRTFKAFTPFKINMIEDCNQTLDEVIKSIKESIMGMFNPTTNFVIMSQMKTAHATFANTYMGDFKSKYGRIDHMADMLLILLYIRHMSDYINERRATDALAEELCEKINTFKEMTGPEAFVQRSDQERLFTDLKKMSLPFNPKILRPTPSILLYLLKEIFS